MNKAIFTSVLALLAGSIAQANGEITDTPDGEPTTKLAPVVVTAEFSDAPLVITSDPQKPRQPIPAHDGADYLKTIPGFSVIRKGGSDGDPVLRGMAGSRLSILLDGEQILGGCGARMDPPTAYVFPESYDQVKVLKGPQTVLNGPGNSAGSVSFERRPMVFVTPTVKARASLTTGSFGRFDQVADVQAGNATGSFRGFANHSSANDYRDGSGNRVHSSYDRWNAGAVMTLTPDENTRMSLTAQHSDGEAAYADRAMDGVSFSRDNVGLSYTRKNLSKRISQIEFSSYYNYVDHVMDNFSLRPAGMSRNTMNPDRETLGAKAQLELRLGEQSITTLGADYQQNTHSNRMAMNMGGVITDYRDLSRQDDAFFEQIGVFAESTTYAANDRRYIAGLRSDFWRAQDRRQILGNMMMPTANPTANQTRRRVLPSGFVRIEQDIDTTSTAYAGLGHSERFPDYWELISYNKESESSRSAFATTDPEKNTQVDIGWQFDDGRRHASASLFYSVLNDYILIESNVARTMPNRITTLTRNIDARSWGGELSAGYRLSPSWSVDSSLAYVRGRNQTDGTPLAQLPPLEVRNSVNWQHERWSAGALWRLVAKQNRVDINRGNIVGQDIGSTGGFGVFSLNAGYALSPTWQLTWGVDNVFDKTYAEHISRSGSNGIAGFDQTQRVNEPGRNAWMKVNVSF
jgi:iron complex outermembrane receptor protein